MDITAERVGNETSAENGHVGITGLEKNHIKIVDNKIFLNYTGKSGVEHEKTITDTELSEYLKKAIKNSSTNYVFCTSDGFCIKNNKINRYLNKFNISAKDIRGYSANHWIIERLKNVDISNKETQRKRQFNEQAKLVAKKVGHGLATLKTHYLIPEIEYEFIEKAKFINISDLKMSNGGNLQKGDVLKMGVKNYIAQRKSEKEIGKPVVVEGGAIVITRNAVLDNKTKHEFNGKKLTNKEILSEINKMNGGVDFAKVGNVDCGCEHSMEAGGYVKSGYNSIDEILEQAKPFQEEIVQRRIAKMKEEGEHISEYEEDMIRFSLIFDLTKALSNYLNKEDKPYDVSFHKDRGVITITAKIERDGNKDNYIHTEMIIAGGHNIQVRHFRYIVHTNLPYKPNLAALSNIDSKIKAIKKKKSNVEKIADLKREIGHFEKRIEKLKESNLEIPKKSDEDILKESYYKEHLSDTYEKAKKRGAPVAENGEQAYNDYVSNIKKDIIDRYKDGIRVNNINIKMLETEIKKYNAKIDKLNSENNTLKRGGEIIEPYEENIIAEQKLNELDKGIEVESAEHLETLNELESDIIDTSEAIKEIAETHIEENPNCYESEDLKLNNMYYIKKEDLGVLDSSPIIVVGTEFYSENGNEKWIVEYFTDKEIKLKHTPKSVLSNELGEKSLTYEQVLELFKNNHLSIKNILNDRELELALSLIKKEISNINHIEKHKVLEAEKEQLAKKPPKIIRIVNGIEINDSDISDNKLLK